MTLEEIKAAFCEKVDAAWEALKSEIDPDAVRTYVQHLTTELSNHVLEVEAHLINHVLDAGKQSEPAPAPVSDQSGETPATQTEAPADGTAEAPDAQEPTQ